MKTESYDYGEPALNSGEQESALNSGEQETEYDENQGVDWTQTA